MTSRPLRAALAAPVLALGLLGVTAPTATAEPPRPGCGYGDENHSHQAAPGQETGDTENLRPGKGSGDKNNTHTFPPGQATDEDGLDGDPRRGCQDDPRS